MILTFLANMKPSKLKIPTCTGKVEKANCLGYLLGHSDQVFVKKNSVKLMLTLCNLCINTIRK